MTTKTGSDPGEVVLELIAIMFTSLKSVLVVGVAFVVSAATISIIHGDSVVAGFGVAGAVVIVTRLAITLGYRRATLDGMSFSDARFWERLYAIGGFAFAGLVGSLSAYIFLTGELAAQLLIATILLAYPSGMIVRVSVRPTIARVQLTLTLAPPAAAALLHGGTEHVLISFLLMAYFVTGIEMIDHLHTTILDRITAHRDLTHLAAHDDLTGLPNRGHFQQRLTEACDRQRRYDHRFAVLYLDLDRFKAVNDTRGHAAGDELLRQVAVRLRRVARSSDIVARLGGDEFALIQTPITDEPDVEALARRIVDELCREFSIAGDIVSVGASVGAAISIADDRPDLVLAAADVALYDAKEMGRGRYLVSKRA